MSIAIAGLVLAGGQSRRMGGGHKFLLELGGKPLLRHAIDRLHPQLGEMAISANCDPAILAPYRLPILPDPTPSGRGPLAGILSGLDWAAERAGTSHLVTVASDTPFFPADLVERVKDAAGNDVDQIVLAVSGGQTHSVFGMWPVSEREPLRAWLEAGRSLKVTDFVESRRWATCEFDNACDPFFNINTPDDLAAAANRLREADQ
ncbi:MAG: molybdenum cofactor guanylyltransferase MobA [Rhizobiaceae bacterium]|nr:molybdenum cofactor guanylyltransferase MobA [Rhizobiaceae bacterium]